MQNRILITGGTGTLGTELVRQLRDQNITIFSRSEKKQTELKLKFPNVNCVIGDIRDLNALEKAMNGIDYVFHTAALKHVNICEDNPNEAVETNILGTRNVIHSAISNEVISVVNMSTDKAQNPKSIYGYTKCLAEAMCNDANRSKTSFVSIRSGNIFGSSGSVVQMFINQIKENNQINITSSKATRFFVSVDALSGFMIDKLTAFGGVYTFKDAKSFSILELAEIIAEEFGNGVTINETGVRVGEKLHEELGKESSKDLTGNKEGLIKMLIEWKNLYWI